MKSVVVHGVLALCGLLFAYRTWTHDEKEEQQPGAEVTIAECDPAKLTQIEMDTQSNVATYRLKRSGTDVEVWVTTQTKKQEDKSKDPKTGDKKPDDKSANDKKADDKKADEKAAAKPADKDAKLAKDDKSGKPAEPDKPEPPKQPRAYDPDAPVTFRANPKFDDTLKALAPLRGVRSLGVIPKAKLKDFGLDKGKDGVVLREQCGDRKIEVQAGGRTYGSGDQYVRDPKSGEVFLIRGQLIMDLQSAMYRFMQTDLHRFTLPEIDEAIIKANGKERKLLHRNRQVPAEARWVDAKEPDKRNELFGNYFQRLSRLKVKAYLDEGKEPGSDLQIETQGVTPVMTVEYLAEGKPKGKFELVRVATKQGNFYYARTESTKRWTVMYDSIGKQVEDDVGIVVGSEAPPAANQSTPSQSFAPQASPVTPAVPGKAAPSAAPGLPPSHPSIH